MSKEQKLELTRRIGLFGLSDLRKIAPIGDLDYTNGWYPPFGDGTWMNGGLERAIVSAAREQRFVTGSRDNGYPHRGTDRVTYFPEIGLKYHVDSSD